MAEAIEKNNRHYTFADYIAWPDDNRCEIIGGLVFSMAPGASEVHQSVSVDLIYQFRASLKDKKCKIFHAPFDVLLPEKGELFENSSNIVQPDILVVCDKDKIKQRGCYGPPDLVIEILSPSTAKRDLKDKRRLYQHVGVREYWIVDPVNRAVHIYKLGENGTYGFPEIFAEDEKINVNLLDDELEIDLGIVFSE